MKKKNIMFQGTGSSVGKSILTAGVCRVLKDMGYHVAPFKSQNMALNSFITKDGKEMGRAQVVQAEAARIEPMVEMNPILLKPSSDVGSQVIVMGEVYQNMTATEYHKNKPKFKNIIKEAYDKLAEEYDAIVIEGAGSTAEINLRENDLVNMGMAEMVDSPVVLIGDIDRGGVFASIYGTYMLLEKEEQARMKGFVINKFRGDVKLLEPGIKMLEDKINIPCLGVIPYFTLHIDDEDSVSLRLSYQAKKDIVVGVLRLPHISNFTDFTPFEMDEDVEVKYIKSALDFKDIDLLIIPGSKNTIEDMVYLNNTGMTKKILEHHKKSKPIIGICGGYQILGSGIIDEGNNESSVLKTNGLGLLNTSTIISNKKRTVQVEGTIDISFMGEKLKADVKGYEIHMGVTKFNESHQHFVHLQEGHMDGAINQEENVLGTYLHGIFDNDKFRKFLLDNIRRQKGIETKDQTLSFEEFKETQYVELGKIIKEHLDVEKILEIMSEF
ncbi:adenosylcobyric acid synthase (glutamine-hydrolysing) [Alkalibaculum bacchi]|uniref:Cobyric acid synthase n=1 Tax=Alkalibaculum bacchi TaxID=645887 RepID=A0A366IET0_9FIRM|nr:cobyric acid synthase [Alkalibaculum bacchi]RBP68932.1 adenosylcobyric acid synthase (glutamine-hydrolysing) [Alkalibaculum bacchi]